MFFSIIVHVLARKSSHTLVVQKTIHGRAYARARQRQVRQRLFTPTTATPSATSWTTAGPSRSRRRRTSARRGQTWARRWNNSSHSARRTKRQRRRRGRREGREGRDGRREGASNLTWGRGRHMHSYWLANRGGWGYSSFGFSFGAAVLRWTPCKARSGADTRRRLRLTGHLEVAVDLTKLELRQCKKTHAYQKLLS